MIKSSYNITLTFLEKFVSVYLKNEVKWVIQNVIFRLMSSFYLLIKYLRNKKKGVTNNKHSERHEE